MNESLTLTAIVDHVNDARLFDRPLAASRRKALAAFLADRQGKPGSYCELFAPVDGEIAGGYRFFTGERINTDAGCRHILGEEALRAMAMLKPTTKAGRSAIERAADAMSRRLHRSETEHGGGIRDRGMYCCLRCSVSLWRVWSLGVMEDADDRLRCGLKLLRGRRDGAGAWRGYPFHYTLSALIDAHTDEARKELRYTRPAVERRLERAAKNTKDIYAARRRRLLELAARIA
jgi:hypothetical protein